MLGSCEKGTKISVNTIGNSNFNWRVGNYTKKNCFILIFKTLFVVEKRQKYMQIQT